VLDPMQKTEHIRKYWGKEKMEEVLKSVAETVSIWTLIISIELMLAMSVQGTLSGNVWKQPSPYTAKTNREVRITQAWLVDSRIIR
jgi:uncharacterized membrane protein YhfC